MGPRIFDCFTFFNETFLLEVRLRSLWSVIDFFCISESSLTHSGEKKELLLEDFFARHPELKSKVRIVNPDLSLELSAWGRENLQRKALNSLLSDTKDSDFILLSDLDEIPNPLILQGVRGNPSAFAGSLFHFSQILANFRFNYIRVGSINGKRPVSHRWFGTVGFCASLGLDLQLVRDIRNPKPESFLNKQFVFKEGGWHLSWMGDDEAFQTKLKSFAHHDESFALGAASRSVDALIESRKDAFFPRDHCWAVDRMVRIYPPEICQLLMTRPDLVLSGEDTVVSITDRIHELYSDSLNR
jgi:hypothetical protein